MVGGDCRGCVSMCVCIGGVGKDFAQGCKNTTEEANFRQVRLSLSFNTLLVIHRHLPSPMYTFFFNFFFSWVQHFAKSCNLNTLWFSLDMSPVIIPFYLFTLWSFIQFNLFYSASSDHCNSVRSIRLPLRFSGVREAVERPLWSRKAAHRGDLTDWPAWQLW